jgi:hypothetical protein
LLIFCLPHRAKTNYKGEEREAAILDVSADLGLRTRVTYDDSKTLLSLPSLLIFVPWCEKAVIC